MITKIKDNTRACQDLVNAQVSVNRAVWAMNVQANGEAEKYRTQHGCDVSDSYIARQIRTAIGELTRAMKNIAGV